MSLVEQIQNLQYSQESKHNMEELQAALDKYHRMIAEGILIPRPNNLQNGYSGQISSQHMKWSNV